MSRIVFESPSLDLAGTGSRAATSRTAARRHAPMPVIVGCPRSGTSLLAVMLDSHPEIAVPPETSFVGAVAGLHGDSADLRRVFFETVTTDRIAVSNWSDFGLDKDGL